MRKERSSNLELFRIITMLLIVAHHYVVNSGLLGAASAPINANITSWRSIFLLLFGLWGKVGINCFVFITGYFMCKSEITLKKFAKLILEIYFYNIVFYIIFLITGQAQFSLMGLAHVILPVTSLRGDFVDCFIVFYLCIPFLNILVRNTTKNQHLYLLLLLLSVYTLMGTLPNFGVVFNYTTWFCILYLISAYVRLYPAKLWENTKFWGICAFVCLTLSMASIYVCIMLPTWLNMANQGIFYNRFIADWFVSDCNKIFAVALGFSAFMFFKNVKIPYSKFINSVGATTFGVLLIHANSDTMRIWLWVKTLKCTEMFQSNLLVAHAFLSVLGVFVICSCIDFCRIRFIEGPFFTKIWPALETKLVCAWKKTASKFLSE